MPRDKNSANIARPQRRACRFLLGLAALAVVAGFVTFFFVGRWLVAEDPVQKAQAIAVLSGGLPLRAMEAAKLYREGYAPKILLTHPAEPADALEALGLPYAAEDFYSMQILVRQGVPKEAIEVVDPPIRNTADEISAISNSLPTAAGTTVIIVTSKVHTRRVRILCHRLAQSRMHGLVHATSDDPFSPGRWWATTSDALDVVREVLGILNAWAGLPVHPSK
jgi:uncharacterized SAM-binding protein YcdF (DUF218 family)